MAKTGGGRSSHREAPAQPELPAPPACFALEPARKLDLGPEESSGEREGVEDV